MRDLEDTLKLCEELRDRIENQLYGEWELEENSFNIAVQAIFRLGFNTYKCIGLLLPELYYEQSSILLRNLWELSLNVHWIKLKPEERAKQFLGFTVVEFRKSLERIKQENNSLSISGLENVLNQYDKALERNLSAYQFLDKKGKTRQFKDFTNLSVEQRARELGQDWLSQYNRIYRLTSAYVHNSPGVVFFSGNISPSEAQAIEDDNTILSLPDEDKKRTEIVALYSISIMIELYQLMCSIIELDDSAYIEEFRRRLSE